MVFYVVDTGKNNPFGEVTYLGCVSWDGMWWWENENIIKKVYGEIRNYETIVTKYE